MYYLRGGEKRSEKFSDIHESAKLTKGELIVLTNLLMAALVETETELDLAMKARADVAEHGERVDDRA